MLIVADIFSPIKALAIACSTCGKCYRRAYKCWIGVLICLLNACSQAPKLIKNNKIVDIN